MRVTYVTSRLRLLVLLKQDNVTRDVTIPPVCDITSENFTRSLGAYSMQYISNLFINCNVN